MFFFNSLGCNVLLSLLEGRKGEWLCLHATPLSLPPLPSNGRGIGHCHQWKEIYDLESLAIMLFFFSLAVLIFFLIFHVSLTSEG
jgi:hypothetical protein